MTLTYPQQQGYPGPVHIDPRYAQQYAPQPVPQQYQQPQPMTPQQFHQAGAAPAPGPSASVELGFQDPSRSGGLSPAARHLVGRTVVMVPKRVDETAKGLDGNSRPTAFFDLYVIDGGPLVFGDSEDRANPRPPSHSIDTPCYFPDVMMGNSGIVGEIRSKIGADGRPTGLSVGVLERGTKGNKPYLMTKCEKTIEGQDRPDGAARRAEAQRIYFAHRDSTWVAPRPVPLAQQQAPAGQGVVNYGQPPQAQQFAHYPEDQQQYAPQQAYAQPQQYAQAPQQGYPAGYGQMPPQVPQAFTMPPMSAPPAPQQAAQPLAPTLAWSAPHLAQQWQSFPPDVQASIWQQETGNPPPVGAPAAAAPAQQTAGQAGPGW